MCGVGPLYKIFRRKLMPNLEHVTWSDPTVTPSKLAISSRLTPCATNSLIFSIACGVNFVCLPLADGLAFVNVMAGGLVKFGGQLVQLQAGPRIQVAAPEGSKADFGIRTAVILVFPK